MTNEESEEKCLGYYSNWRDKCYKDYHVSL